MKQYKEKYRTENVVLDFHTHPDVQLGATSDAPEISKDVEVMRKDKVFIPNASFLILYRSSYEMKEYDYTE